MISTQDLERLVARNGDGGPVLSLFLDMSVDSNNKRNHEIFLARKRAQFEEMVTERTPHVGNGREEAGGFFERVQAWLEDEFSEANRGVVIYAEVDGDWFEALQFPVAVQNRMVVSDRPVVGPLAQVLRGYEHYGVVLLDREHVRILSVYLGTLLDEVAFHGEPLAARTQIQAGGYSQTRFQRRKLEEMKHFFRDFAAEVERFDARYAPPQLVLLGTEANLARFREHLPDSILQKVVYTGPMPVDEPASEVLRRLEPHLRAEQERNSQELIAQVRGRAAQDYLATAGVGGTLVALQEGKVETLVLARDGEVTGSRCRRCGFVFVREVRRCPYDGAEELEEVEVMEEMVRLAEHQGVEIEFADPGQIEDLRGAAALLRF